MVKIKSIYEAYDDIVIAEKLWCNGLLSFNALIQVIEYNFEIINHKGLI